MSWWGTQAARWRRSLLTYMLSLTSFIGGGGGGEAPGHPHHCEAAGGRGQDLGESGQDGPAAFCHRCQCGGSTENFPGQLVPIKSSKISLLINPVLNLKVKHKILCIGFDSVSCAFRGPWRCWGLHHWRRSGANSQVWSGYCLQPYLHSRRITLGVLGLRSSWRSASQSEPRSRSTPSSRTLRSRSTLSGRCRRCWPPWSGEGSCSTGCRGRCSTGSSRLEEKSNWKLSQCDFSVYTHLQFNIYFPYFILLILLIRELKLLFF